MSAPSSLPGKCSTQHRPLPLLAALLSFVVVLSRLFVLEIQHARGGTPDVRPRTKILEGPTKNCGIKVIIFWLGDMMVNDICFSSFVAVKFLGASAEGGRSGTYCITALDVPKSPAGAAY